MSDYKSILLHFDSSPRAALRLRLAHRLAEAHGAQVTALFAVTSALMRYPYAASAEAGMGAVMAELDVQRREQAQALFRQTAGSAMPRVRWATAADLSAEQSFKSAALYADLLVLGQRPPEGEGDSDVSPHFVQTVVMGSGRPALVLPHSWEGAAPVNAAGASAPRPQPDIGRVALVAWKETRESAHAVSAALPMLRQSAEVHVVRLGEHEALGADSAPPPDGIATYLARHGITAKLHDHPAEPARSVGERLLSLAADLNADLLVMGCFSHSRAREWVLGGATRTVLNSMTLPVLMAH